MTRIEEIVDAAVREVNRADGMDCEWTTRLVVKVADLAASRCLEEFVAAVNDRDTELGGEFDTVEFGCSLEQALVEGAVKWGINGPPVTP